jgi:hypothetical protein
MLELTVTTPGRKMHPAVRFDPFDDVPYFHAGMTY